MIKNILFTSVGRRVELVEAFRDAADRLGRRVCIHGSDIATTAPALFYCNRTHITVKIRNPKYIPELLEICKDNSIDLLIPTIDTDLLILSEHKEEFEAIGTKVMISAPEMIRICRDKRFTADFFEKCGLKSPQPVDSISQYKGGYPCFIKPKDGSSSINAFAVNSEEELKTYVREVPDYIIQPFIEGREYTIDMFCDYDGDPVYITPRERILVREGEVIKTIITADPQMVAEAKAIATKFHPCGPITVQLIRDSKTNTDYFIEINPRFGGGAPLSMKAGADSAGAAIKLLFGEKLTYEENAAEDGLEYSRFDQSVLSGGTKLTDITKLSDVASKLDGIRGVILDLDDTLYDEVDYVKSGFHVVAEIAARWYGEDEDALFDELLSLFDAGREAISELVSTHEAEDSEESRAREQELLEAYRGQNPSIKMTDEAQKLINILEENKIAIGIISDGPPARQHKKLEVLGLDSDPGVKEIIITDELAGESNDPHIFRKPCPVAFEIMAMRMGLPYRKLAYVGDNISKDFIAPGRLGMQCFWYHNPVGIHNDSVDRRSI